MLILGRPQNEENCVWISPGRAGPGRQINQIESPATAHGARQSKHYRKKKAKAQKREINGQKRTSNWRPSHMDFHFPAERKALADLRIVFQSGVLHPLGPAHSHAMRNALRFARYPRRLSLAVVLIGLIIGVRLPSKLLGWPISPDPVGSGIEPTHMPLFIDPVRNTNRRPLFSGSLFEENGLKAFCFLHDLPKASADVHQRCRQIRFYFGDSI